ncbi:MAG: MBL fold metallo-hydrolase [Dysgonamonadaceae bacterium]|nr:MBL fold metallo-hydrolase [Dysgonamonadaceae bacterium]
MWQYRILETGFFHADGGAMFGAVPKRAWKRKYPSGDDNCCILAMNCVLLWSNEKVILFDTGVGTKDLGKWAYYRFHDTKDIVDLVKGQGFHPDDITDVILSHLHFDHCGGCTYRDKNNQLQITFPNAKHYVGEAQWDNYLNPNLLEKHSFGKDDMMPVKQADLLTLIDEDIELYPNLFLSIYPGHTIGQILLSFLSEEGWIVCPSDIIPTKAHLPDDWISAYDVQPLESLNAKISLKEKIKNTSASFIFYHDAYKKVSKR